MNRPFPALGIGWIFAVVGLVLTIVFWANDTLLNTDHLAITLVAAFLAILL